MTGSGMAEYTVRPEYRLRLPGGMVVSHDFKTLEQSAKKEAHEAGVAVMEVRYPGGGGYIVEYKDGQGNNINYLPRDWED